MTAINGVPPDQLRLLVREVLAEVVGNLPPRQPASGANASGGARRAA